MKRMVWVFIFAVAAGALFLYFGLLRPAAQQAKQDAAEQQAIQAIMDSLNDAGTVPDTTASAVDSTSAAPDTLPQ